MGHIVLLGDSIFDNGAYVSGGPDVLAQLQGILPEGWQASLAAVDGATTAGVHAQLGRLPQEATHLLISAGGNDALGETHLLAAPAGSVAEALSLLAQAQQHFAADYAAMLDAVLSQGLPTAVCTVYDTPRAAPGQPAVRTGLTLFNDVITRAAFARKLPVIDLRLICDADEDYANPIEPSVQGGGKIAAAIARLIAADWQAERVGWSQVIA